MNRVPLEHALALARLGLAVLPVHGVGADGRCACGRNGCDTPGKHPRTKHGHLDASTEIEQIRKWWGACATANVGVRTGDGIVVLDIDPRNGGGDTVQGLIAKHGELETWTVRTGGGGRHFYFRSDSGLPTRPSLFRGIDFKATGGFVVAPPSVHASGRRYEWVSGRSPSQIELASLPDWLVEAVRGQSNERNAANGSNAVREGTRNTHLASFAGAARRRGLDGKKLVEVVLEENARRCKPPLPRTEVERIASSINRYPAAGAQRSVEEMLTATGAAALTKASSLDECEAVLRKLAGIAPELDSVQRAVLRAGLARRRVLPARAVEAVLRTAPQVELDPSLDGRPLSLSDVDPWPEAVTGDALLDELVALFRRHVVLPAHAAEALALWVVHTHAIAAAEITPRLAILSPEKRCGKTTLLKLLGTLVRRPLSTTNVTPAALFRTIEKFEPTLLVDEADTFLAEREELRGILNTGHDRQGAEVLRCVGEKLELRSFKTWAPVAIAAIGSIHDTMRDRSIVVRMKRRTPREQVAPLRRRHIAQLEHFPRRCARWARDNAERVGAMDVQSPDGLGDRAADNWEPLLAIADVVGAAWLATARAAALALSSPSAGDDGDSRGQVLLADVRSLLGTDDRVTTKQLLAALNHLEDRPWADSAGGKGLSPHQLSRMLARFDVRPRTIRFGTTTAKGFLREDFEDAFARYLSEAGTSVTRAPEQATSRDSDPSQAFVVTDSTTSGSPGNPAVVTDVTDPPDDLAAHSNIDPNRRRHLDS